MDSLFDLLEAEIKNHLPPNPAAQQAVSAIKTLMRVLDKGADDRNKLLQAIPECELHGLCIPHALNWIEQAAQAIANKTEDQTHNNDSSNAADCKTILLEGLSLEYDSNDTRKRLKLYGSHRLAKMALSYAEATPDKQAGDLFFVLGKRLGA